MDNQIQTLTFNMLPMTIGVLPSSYVDSMSYYETLLWLCNYLENTVIPTVNNNGEAVEELQSAYITLHDYVEHYFDNLDVQTEINNKLDQMTEDGTLTNLIKAYVDPIYEAYETRINGEITSLTSQVQSATSGSPKGVYATVSDLETADPDHDYIYLVTADGKWYYYDTSLTAWTAGGVYQASSIANDSVGYNELKDLIKDNDFKTIDADDLLWVKGYSIYQATVSSSDNKVLSNAFILPKGNTISTGEGYYARITYYDLSGNYIGQTSYSAQTNWSYTDDCLVRLCVERSTESTEIAESECNSSNIILSGVTINNITDITYNLKLTNVPDTNYLYSNPIYLPKGTKIGLMSSLLKYNGSYKSNGVVYYAVQHENTSFSYGGMGNYRTTNVITLEKDELVRLWFRAVNADINLGSYTNLLNDIYISKNGDNLNIDQFKYPYVASNKAINIIENGSSGSILFNTEDEIGIIEEGLTLLTFDMTTLASTFSDSMTTVNDVSYLVIPANKTLIYDKRTSALSIVTSDNRSIILGNEILPLITNKYNNVCGGLLFDLYLKTRKPDKLAITNDLDLFNSMPYVDYSWETPVKKYSKELNGLSSNIDTYLFFTDPHIMGSYDSFNEKSVINYINKLEKVYNSIPIEHIICGGDWLNNGDTQDEACFKLGYLTGFMYSKFKNYYPMFGNHDSNYQGKLDSESALYTGELEADVTTNLMFAKYGKKYYKFAGNNNMNYVLDTGLDSDASMDTYKWNQIDWLASELLSDDSEHATVFMHIIWINTTTPSYSPMTDPVTLLLNAYNNHTTVTLNSTEYDFTNTTGHVDYIIGGHVHSDFNNTLNGILCIATDDFMSGSIPTYDLVINDYDNNKVKLIRVGTGSDREFTI